MGLSVVLFGRKVVESEGALLLLLFVFFLSFSGWFLVMSEEGR